MAEKLKLKTMTELFITRKEAAARRRISDDTIGRHEREWGLDAARDKYCRRPIRYRLNHPATRRFLEESDED